MSSTSWAIRTVACQGPPSVVSGDGRPIGREEPSGDESLEEAAHRRVVLKLGQRRRPPRRNSFSTVEHDQLAEHGDEDNLCLRVQLLVRLLGPFGQTARQTFKRTVIGESEQRPRRNRQLPRAERPPGGRAHPTRTPTRGALP